MAPLRVGHHATRSVLVLLVGLAPLLSGSLAHAAAAPAPTTVQGRLVSVHGDDIFHGRPHYSLFLQTAQGRIRLRVTGSDHSLPVGAVVRVRGNRLSDGSVEVSRDAGAGNVQVVASPTSATGTKNVAVLLFNFTNDASKPWTVDSVRGVMFTGAGSVAAYFNEESYGKLTTTGDVFGWYSIPYDNSGCQYSTWASAAKSAASAAGVNLSGYSNIVYAFPYTSNCAWAGLAYMPGTESWANGYMQLSVVGHELSHNFGVHHANSYRCTSGSTPVFVSATCTSSEYGDPFSIMGSGSTRHTHNWQLGQLGWLTSADTVTVTTGGTYTLGAAELAASPKAVRVAWTGGKYFYLEYRRPYGTYFDNFSSSDPAVNGVSIRLAPDYPTITQSQLLDATPSTSTFSDAPLAAGKSVTDPDSGITFTTQSVSSTTATIGIAFAGDTTPPSVPSNVTGSRTKPRQATLRWNASTDNVGVAGYRVYRDGVVVGTTTLLTYADRPPRRAVTYYVVAYDAAGNTSPASNSVTL